jgi:nuclear migration protein JNM1
VDDEDLPAPEGLRRKIARLQRQARELKAEAERLQQDKEVKAKDSEDHGDKMDRPIEQSTMEELNSAINDLESAGNIGSPVSASARLALRLGDAANLRPASSERTQSDSAKNTSVEHSPYTFTHQPSSSQSHALALAASLDSRLTAIETALGLSSLPLSTQSPESYPKPILPSIDILELKLRLLTSTTASSLEPVASRLRQMNYEAEALSEKRRTARLNYEEIRTSSSDIYAHQKEDSPSSRPRSGEDAPRRMATSLLGDPEVEAKINALYGTLPTIENVAPMLPNLVERLRSLRLMHQEAADAGIRLEDVETKARGMDEECKRWREGLERVENKISEGEDTIKKNTEAVDNWVKELEARVEALK